MLQVRRSWLLIPASRPDMIEQSGSFNADVIVLDLEDLVHDSKKHEARSRIKDGIANARGGGAEVFVRCDLELLYADLEASVWRGLDGVILPKITTVGQALEAEQLLAEFEFKRGVTRAAPAGEVNEADDARTLANSIELHLSLENAKGNHNAEALIAASPRVRSVSLGRADLVMDLRPEPGGDLHLLPYLMQRLIVIARATGVDPIGAWWQADSRGLRATPEATERAATLGRAAGFRGAICVEPEQVEPMNDGFTPSRDEIERARELVDAFAALPDGAVYLRRGDTLHDRSTAASAESCLAWAAACAQRDAAKSGLAPSPA
jgi:citrate lyase subunit beta / citryl-CoA lyase